MCGIAGFVEFGVPQASQEDLLAMRQRLRHRGPDDQGHWFTPGVGLAHARLSILDLSLKAHQPMRCGNLVLVYNGEIYNYRSLRDELRGLGHRFTSDSDTEVLLCGFAQWGPAVLGRLDGMFAFAVYDEGARTLFLARDKGGIKPLVYYSDGQRFVFASELKALWHYPGLRKELSPKGLEDYLRLGFTTGRVTMFEGCLRLLPGECVYVSAGTGNVRHEIYAPGYFRADPTIDFDSARAQLKPLLAEEFKKSLTSDVPVGVCISGGVDSNVLSGLLAREHGFKLKTYSLGSNDTAFDENARAAAVAKHLGTGHRSLTIDPSQAPGLFMDTIAHYDEPMADQNILSLRAIARQARTDGVKVLLSGLGGDELFWGYPTIDLMSRSRWLFSIPQGLRHVFPKEWFTFSSAAYKAVHLGRQSDIYAAMYGLMGNCFLDDEVSRLMLHRPGLPREDYLKKVFDEQMALSGNVHDAFMRADLRSYLTDNGLAISDVSAMAEGVEMRVPYLNSPIMDFALRVPAAVKKHKGQLKALLRSIEAEHIPAHLTVRTKQGFYPFVRSSWIDGPLKDLVRAYLSPEHVRGQGLFNEEVIGQTLGLHRKSKVNVSGKLWNILVFQLWAKDHL